MLFTDFDTLTNLTQTADLGFEDAFNKLSYPGKVSMQSFLIYVDKVLSFMLARETDGLRCTQIHFPEMKNDLKKTLLEFIVIRQFYRSLEKDMEQDNYILDRVALLNKKLMRNQAPIDASGNNGGNAAYKKWMAEKGKWKKELAILMPIEHTRKSLGPDTILNILNGDLPVLQESLYAMTPEDLDDNLKRAYCLLNLDLPIDQLIKRLSGSNRLEAIKQVILFDCEGRKGFTSYNKRMLEKFIERGYAMKDLVIFSFDKHPFRLRNLIAKLDVTYRNYFLSPLNNLAFKDTYVLQEQEVDQLIIQRDLSIHINWIGGESELFADYQNLMLDHKCSKLRTLSTLNIYAAALNWKIADLIINDLFGKDTKQGVFDADTRTVLSRLDTDERDILKHAIYGLLDMVIQEWECIKKEMAKHKKKGHVGIVVPPALAKIALFRRELKLILPDQKVNIYTWKDVRDEDHKDPLIFILTYRDTGRYPFIFYPSLIERGPNRESYFIPLLIKMFFGEKYTRCNYSYHFTLNQLLRSEFRYKFLDWNKVELRINNMKPSYQEETAEEDEEEDELINAAESIRATYTDDSHATFYLSRPLLIRKEEGGVLEVLRADELPGNIDDWAIQPLDELYEDLNLFQITPDEEQELQLIKRQHGVTNPAHVLWKVLLAKKLEEARNSRTLYENIAKLVGEKDFVQFDYFKNYWLDKTSKLLIPRKRKHFRLICDHLGLPRAYYRLKLKIRSSLTENSRQSTLRMNSLLSQMINEGLFAEGVDWERIPLQHFMEQHELEEKGITNENLKDELKALVHLLAERVQLKRVKKIERS